MMKPPFIVNRYFFPYVEVAADPEYTPKKGIKTDASFETKVSVDKSPEEDTHQVMLEVTIFPENEENKIPYSIHLVAVGLFTVSKRVEDPEKLLSINGSSILYSAAREFIITLTSRGPWPAVMLPTVSFLPSKDDESVPPIAEDAPRGEIRKSKKIK